MSPLSLYAHIPFCESICYYCACNKAVTRRHERAGPYLKTLELEMALRSAVIGPSQPVPQLRLGWVTPTFLSDTELAERMSAIRYQQTAVDRSQFSCIF